jgi:protein TonB
MRPAPAMAQAAPVSAPLPQIPQQTPGSGVDALGEGDISIALMQFFPDPKPDLTRLPHGSRGDVVLEAVINVDGRIAQLTVKQGVGYGVDESVIATVEQWTFHPAMRDGKPVASQQEFHFHYERG